MDNLTLDIIAKLNKKLSENSIDGDLKKLDNKISVKVLARLSKSLASRELKRQIETLNNMGVSIGTELNADNGLEHQLQQNINSLQQSIADLEIGLRFSETSQDTEDAQSSLQNMIEHFKDLFSSVEIVPFVFQQAKEAVNTTIELDKAYTALTDVQSQLTRNGYSAYLKRCNEKAQELATTQQSLIDGATEFSKSGYGLAASESLSEKSAILSKIGSMETSASTEAIMSGIQAFDTVDGYTGETDKAQALLDKYSAVGNTADITAGEIARGVQIAGSAFADANTDADEFIALLSAGNRQYQDADALAEGLRTAALRIHGCTEELEKMGEETDGVYSSARLLEDKIEGLTDIGGSGGVKILEADGESLRSIYDIFLDISKIYSQMSEADASALLELIGGSHAAPAMDAVLSSMPESQGTLQDSRHADGSAQQEYNNYLQSTEAHIQQFQAKLVEVYSSFTDGNMISHAADLGTAVLDIATKADLLKHTLVSIAALKIGQKIANIGGTIAGTASQMNALGNAIHMAKALPTDTNQRENALKAIGTSTKSLSDANLKLLLSQKQLSDQDRLSIVQARTINEAEAQATLERLGLTQATNANTASNAANASSVTAMSGTFTGLKASIQAAWVSMSALQKASIIFAAVSTAWSVVSSVISRHNQAEVEAVQYAKQSAGNYKESSSSIEDYTKRYVELRQALLAAKGNEEETYNVKKQLLELQTEMNEKYGDECDKINLVTDAYNDQTDAIKNLNKENANKFLNENTEGINIAKRKMESESTYDLTYAVAKTEDNEEILTDIAEKYKDSGMSILDTGESFYITLTANPEDAYQVINDFQTDVRDAAKELGNEHLFDNTVLNVSSDSLNKIKNMLDEYQEIYDQTKMAQIATDDDLSDGYNEALSAVEAYNEAVMRSKDPYNDENVKKTWDNLQSIKHGIRENEEEWRQYSHIMDDVFSAANDGTYSFYQTMQKDSSISGLADNLSGMSDTNLKSMADDGNNGDSFDKLYAKAKEYGLEVQDLISLLAKLGYVQNDIYKNDTLSFPEAWDSLDATEDDSLKALKNDLLSLAEAGQLTVESFHNTKGSEEFLARLGLEPGDAKEIQEVIGKVNQLASSSEQLASMKKGISGLTENLRARQENPGTAIGSDVLAGMDESLKSQTSEWEHYQSVMGSASSSMEEVQEATNRLASAFLNNNNYLANLTESEKAYYISQLEAMGVANAEETVQQSLVDKHELNRLKTEALHIATDNVTDATMAEVNSFLQEQGASYGAANAIMAAVEAKRIFANEGLGLTTQISQLETFINKTYGAAAAIRFAGLTGGYDDRGYKKTNGMSMQEAMKTVEAEFMPLKNLKLDFSGGGSGGNTPNKTPSQTPKTAPPKTETPEDFNFIETAIARIKTKVDEARNAAREAFASFKSRRKYYAGAISQIAREIDIQTQADQLYTERANKVGLDEKYAAQVREGSLNIETISDEGTKKRIREYKEWYEKSLACKEAVRELKKEQEALARENIELLVTKYEKLFSRLDAKNNKIKNIIDAKEAWGFSADIKNYKDMNKNILSQIGNIRSQNKELAKLKETVAKSSEEWYEYDKRMQSNNETAQNLKKTMAENAKAAAALPKAKADKKIGAYDSADEMIDAKLDRTIRPKLKNGLINQKIDNIKYRQDAYNAAVKTDKHNIRVAKNRLIKTAKPKKSQTKAEKNMRTNIRALAKAGKPITQKLLQAAYNLKDKGKLYNACLMYNAYLEARDADKAAAGLYAQTSKQDKADLAMERFNNTAAGYDYSLAENEQKKTALNSKIALDEERGLKANLAYYERLLSAENGTQKKLAAKRDALQKSLDQAVSRGLIKTGSDEWYEMADAINSVTNEMNQSVLSATELKNTIRQIKWDTFDASLETIQRINSEADFFIGLMGKNKDLIGKDNSEFTEYGKATLKLYKQQYESYLAQADAYTEEYNDIMRRVSTKELSLDDEAVIQRLRELQDAQRDSKLSAEDVLSSITSLIREQYEAQLDALDKLIQKYKDLRQNEKDAYEYQKNIAEKTKNIAALQKQLHAYGGNDTEEARAKIQKLKADLETAQQNLAEAEYDKYLSDMNDMLDGLYDDFASFIDEKLNDTDAILATINDSLCGKSDSIIATLAALNGSPSPDLQALLKGDISSAEFVKRIIETDQRAQEQRQREEENRRREEERQKGRDLESNARTAQKMIPEIDIQIHGEEGSLANMQDRLAAIRAEEQKQKELREYAKKTGAFPLSSLPQKDFTEEKRRLTQNISDSKKRINSLKKKRNAYEADINAYETWKKNHKDLEFPTLQPGTVLTFVPLAPSQYVLPDGSETASAQVQAQALEYAQMPPEDARALLHIEPQPAYAAYAAPAAAPDLPKGLDAGNVNVAINELSLPGVTNYEDFKAALIRDSKFERAVQAMTIDRAAGGHSMAKLRHI